MNEMGFCRYLVGKFRELGARASRIENAVSSGIPDINIHAYGEERWFEAKICDHASGIHASKIRPSQYCWHRDQVRAGGNAFIVVYNRKTDSVGLFESRDVISINEAPWVSDQRGAKPTIVCAKKDFIKCFLQRYCEKREEFPHEPAGIRVRTSNRVETSQLTADVDF